MELELVPSNDIVINSEPVSSTVQPLPTSLKLVKTVKVNDHPTSVCWYNGSTYVGFYDCTVTRIDSNYQVYNNFITCSDLVESITVYKDRFYILTRCPIDYSAILQSIDSIVSTDITCTVEVYDISGQHITSWYHPLHVHSNILTVVADQVVVADPYKKSLAVYTLTGETLRHIPCPMLSNSDVTICAVDDTSIAISDWKTSKVQRVNISTEELIWTSSDVVRPQAMTLYAEHILLTAHMDKTIYILDTTTGNIVSEIADDAIFGFATDLEAYDTTLVVPAFDSMKVLFYQMNG